MAALSRAHGRGAMSYYIQRACPGSSLALWWRPDAQGYTARLDEAGIYTEERARAQEQERPGVDRAVAVEEAQRLAVRVVSAEALPPLRGERW